MKEKKNQAVVQRQALRKEAYRIAVLMIEPALCGDAPLVEENDIEPELLKQELQRISDMLRKRMKGKEHSAI